jgi:hypothetical protein
VAFENAKPGEFRCPSIVQHPGNGSPNDGYADNLLCFGNCNSEQTTRWGFKVSMVKVDKPSCVF